MLKTKKRWVLPQSYLAVGPVLAAGQMVLARKPTHSGSLVHRAPEVKTPTAPKAPVGRDTDICL